MQIAGAAGVPEEIARGLLNALGVDTDCLAAFFLDIDAESCYTLITSPECDHILVNISVPYTSMSSVPSVRDITQDEGNIVYSVSQEKRT